LGGQHFLAPLQTGPGAHLASYAVGTGSFLGVNHLGRGINHPAPPSTEFKERVQLYLYSLSVPSWQVITRTSPSPLPLPVFNDVCRWDCIASNYSMTSEQSIGNDLEGCAHILILNTVTAFA